MNGYIIEILHPEGEEDALYWGGTDTVASTNEAAFYNDRASAKYAAKDMVTRFIDADVNVVSATRVITRTR